MSGSFPDFLDKHDMEDPTNGRLVGRLYNFETGVAALNDSHKQWIQGNLAPLFAQQGTGKVYVHLWGYASKIGSAGANQRLSEHRAEEAKKFLTSLIPASAAGTVFVGGYGTTHSGGGTNDNNPIYRAVDVYVKREPGPKPPPPFKPPKPPVIKEAVLKHQPAKPHNKFYFGPAVKGGGFLAVGGAQLLEAMMFSLEDFNDRFQLNGQIYSAGLGLGAGANVDLVIAYGGSASYDFIGCKFGGWDFNLSFGGRFGDLLKTAKGFPSLVKLAEYLKDVNLTKLLANKGVIKSLLTLKVDEWEKLGNRIKQIKDAGGAVFSDATKPQVAAFDLPGWGYAIEVDVMYSWGKVLSVEE